LYQPTSGKIRFDGNDVTKLPPNERHCGFMFESYALFPHLNIIDNVGYARHVQGLPAQETYTIAQEILNLVRIQNRDTALPKECSGGMQQRVALARSIMAMESSGLVILDEPFKALDAGLRRTLRQEVRNIAKSGQLQLTTIHVTNDVQEAMMGDKILVLDQGEIKQFGTPEEILYSPKDLFTANFFSTELNYFHGKVLKIVEASKTKFRQGPWIRKIIIQSQEGYFLYAKSDKEFKIGDEVTFLIRSHHFKSRHGRREDKTNSIVGKVKRVKFMGPWFRMEVETPFRLDQLIPEKSKETLAEKRHEIDDESDEELYELRSQMQSQPSESTSSDSRIIKIEVPTTKLVEINYRVGEIITVFYPSEYCIVFPRISDQEIRTVMQIH